MKLFLLIAVALLSLSSYASESGAQKDFNNLTILMDSSSMSHHDEPILPLDERSESIFSEFLSSRKLETPPQYDEIIQAMGDHLTTSLFDPDISKEAFQRLLTEFRHIYHHFRCYNDQNLNTRMITLLNDEIEDLLKDMKLAENSCKPFFELFKCSRNFSNTDTEKEEVKQYIENYQQCLRNYISPCSCISKKFFANMDLEKEDVEFFSRFSKYSNASISRDYLNTARRRIQKYIKRYRKGLQQCINQYNSTPEKLSLLTEEYFPYPPVSNTETIRHFKFLFEQWSDINHLRPDIYRFLSLNGMGLYPNTTLLHSLSNIWLKQSVLHEGENVFGYDVFPWEDFKQLFRAEYKSGGLKIAIIWDYLKEILAKHIDATIAPDLIKEIIDYASLSHVDPNLFRDDIVLKIILPYIIQPLKERKLMKILLDSSNDQKSVVHTITYSILVQVYMVNIAHNQTHYLYKPEFEGLYKILEAIFDAITDNQITDYISGKIYFSDHDLQKNIILPLQRNYSHEVLDYILQWMKNKQKILNHQIMNREEEEGILQLRKELTRYQIYYDDLLQYNQTILNHHPEQENGRKLLQEYELKIIKRQLAIKQWEYDNMYKEWWQSEQKIEWGEWKKQIERLEAFFTLCDSQPHLRSRPETPEDLPANKRARLDDTSESSK